MFLVGGSCFYLCTGVASRFVFLESSRCWRDGFCRVACSFSELRNPDCSNVGSQAGLGLTEAFLRHSSPSKKRLGLRGRQAKFFLPGKSTHGSLGATVFFFFVEAWAQENDFYILICHWETQQLLRQLLAL